MAAVDIIRAAIGQASAGSVTGVSITITAPADVAAGDQFVILISKRDKQAAAEWSAPAGWHLRQHIPHPSTGEGYFYQAKYGVDITGTEWVFKTVEATATTDKWAVSGVVLKGVGDYLTSNAQARAAAGTTTNSGDITTTVSANLVGLAGDRVTDASTWTWPAGWIEQADVNSGAGTNSVSSSCAVNDATPIAAGTYSVTATGSKSVDDSWAGIFAFAVGSTDYTASPADSASGADSATPSLGYNRTTADTTGGADSVTTVADVQRSAGDSAAASDAAAVALSAARTITDSVGSTDAATWRRADINNVLTGDKADFQDSAGGWAEAANTGQFAGAWSSEEGGVLRYDVTGAGPVNVGMASHLTADADLPTISPGQEVTGRIQVRQPAGTGKTVRLQAQFYDAAKALLTGGTVTITGAEATATTAWQTITGTLAAPTGAAYVRLRALAVSTVAGDVLLWNDAYLARGAVNHTSSPADTAGGADTVAVSLNYGRQIDDAVGATDSVTAIVSAEGSISDVGLGTDAVSQTRTSTRTHADSAAGSDVVTIGRAPAPIADNSVGSDSVSIVQSISRTPADTATARESVALGGTVAKPIETTANIVAEIVVGLRHVQRLQGQADFEVTASGTVGKGPQRAIIDVSVTGELKAVRRMETPFETMIDIEIVDPEIRIVRSMTTLIQADEDIPMSMTTEDPQDETLVTIQPRKYSRTFAVLR